MIYVYTSILNGWDNLRPPAVHGIPGVRFFCFTNVPVLPPVEPWEFQLVYPEGPMCRAARYQKILAHLALPSDAEYSIYHDGNLSLTKHPLDVIDRLLQSADWAAHRHPCRTCIYQEADIILNHPTMQGWRESNPEATGRVLAEVGSYRAVNYPVNAGLWANGFIVRRHTAAVASLNERWWQLYNAGCERDQLSFPVARKQAGVEVNTIDANIYESPYVSFFWHAAWKDKASNVEFHPEREIIRSRLAALPDAERARLRVDYPDF